jgi:multidrug efflux pump subunit AcrB
MASHDDRTTLPGAREEHGATNRVVQTFLSSNLSVVLILLAAAIGGVALLVTPREEDPQIVVPLADVTVSYPGRSAAEIEQLVSTPLEKVLYEIDGVEYVYSMSRQDQAVVTVRFYVGQDRERSLVKIFKKIDEHRDIVPAGASWVVKPVEIDDVPIVTLTLRSATAGSYTLRRVGEELVRRLSTVQHLSRAYVVGGQPRVVTVRLDPARMEAHGVSPLQIGRVLSAASSTATAGSFTRGDQAIVVEAGRAFADAKELAEQVVAVNRGRPVLLKDVADVVDGPDEADSYVRHAWGPAHAFAHGGRHHPGAGGTLLGNAADAGWTAAPVDAVTVAFAKKKGSNAVAVAERVLAAARKLRAEVVPGDVQVVVTRNYGLTADEKVNELVEALGVAIVIVVGLLILSLGWREALIVAVAVPVVFGLTLAVNQLAGFTINRVTLFALILSLGLLVDDPIVDVENISRHFSLAGRATRKIVLDAVAEIRPPLIAATLAVILSFIPMFFITGMMGPYMRPMALNVPVAMLMSMLVAFTITPWLSYHALKGHFAGGSRPATGHELTDLEALRKTRLWRLFYPLMAPLLKSRLRAVGFCLAMVVLTVGAVTLAALRAVPLKMLPFDNKNELLLVLDLDEGTTLERTDAAVRDFERYLAGVPEVADVTSYVGVASPMDFNGMVRHYYLRRGDNVAELRVNLVGKKSRRMQSHAIGLRMRKDLDELAKKHRVALKVVETPPGPPVLQTLVAEVYGAPRHTYAELTGAAKTLRERFEKEPGVVDVDDSVEAPQTKLVFVTDRAKAALHGVSLEDVTRTLQMSLGGCDVATVREPSERQPLNVRLRVPRPLRSSAADLSAIRVNGSAGLVPLSELGRWEETRVPTSIYHKNLERVVFVTGDTAGRAPAEAILDIGADRDAPESRRPRPVAGRTFLRNGSWIPWRLPEDVRVDFAGEGEWKITIDVFRDLGLAFLGAMIAIYILLVAQTSSFVVPVVVMLAIPLTAIGVLPGFFILNVLTAGRVGGYADPVFFTATGMIGMIALAGIVTRDSIILVDFIQLSVRRGRSLFDAIMESRIVRLRPILLTASAAMLSALPITIDPIFSGLAWSLIFGLLSSTVFTLFVIPVTYWLLYSGKESADEPTGAGAEAA